VVNNININNVFVKNVANVTMNTINLNTVAAKPIDTNKKVDELTASKIELKDADEKAEGLKNLISVGEYNIDIDKLGMVLLKNI
jgi:anti-sigma28 factor (negative regulator of flagellin synthesis)